MNHLRLINNILQLPYSMVSEIISTESKNFSNKNISEILNLKDYTSDKLKSLYEVISKKDKSLLKHTRHIWYTNKNKSKLASLICSPVIVPNWLSEEIENSYTALSKYEKKLNVNLSELYEEK